MSFCVLELPPKKDKVTLIVRHWKKILVGEWNWMRPIKSIAFIYLVLLVIALRFSDHLIHQPPAAGYTSEAPAISLVKMDDGRNIAITYLPAAPGMPTLLWSHGNAEDIGYLRQRHLNFHILGYGILAYDYPGYGISDGSPDEQGCYDACMTAWKHLTETLKIPTDRIIIYGQSVGSGPSVWLATKVDCAGLILVSPFVSAFRTVTQIPLFPGDKFKNLSHIDQINMPLLVIHGDRDQVIPQWHGKKLHDTHPGPKLWAGIEGVGHNDIYFLAEDDILQTIQRFRNQCLQKK